MKGNIKKLAVLMIVATLALFMGVATSSAFGPFNIPWGKYAFTGSGTCLVSTEGFDSNLNPNPNGLVFLDTQIWEGDYTFNGHSSGTMKARNRGVDTYPFPPNPSFLLSIKDISWEFIYDKTSLFRFKYHLKPGTYDQITWVAGGQQAPAAFFEIDGSCDGVVALNGQTITVSCGPPGVILTAVDPSTNPVTKLPVQALCGFSHVGIWVDE